MKPLSLLLMVVALVVAAGGGVATAGPYAPAAGMPGSTAIPADSPLIIGWATGVTSLIRGPREMGDPDSPLAGYGVAGNALGRADATPDDPWSVVSLGDGGSITLSFDFPITNGPGPDFAVFENGFQDSFLELAFVEVSSDGINYFRFPSHSLTQTTSQIEEALDPTNIDGLAGKYRAGFGTPFDLEEMKGFSLLLDVNDIIRIRIRDVVGSIDPRYASFDSELRMINDPWTTRFTSGGFDLDAIGVLHQTPEPDVVWLATLGAVWLFGGFRLSGKSGRSPVV